MDGQGNISAVNTFGPTGLLSRHSATGSTFYTFDAQGSVAQRLDSNGNVLSTSIYDSFGNKISTEPQTDPWGYNAQAGYYTDAETGLILCTHRYYDPTQGRWLNRDPIGYAGGLNLYGYVGNGAVGGVDPSGFQGIVPPGGQSPMGPWGNPNQSGPLLPSGDPQTNTNNSAINFATFKALFGTPACVGSGTPGEGSGAISGSNGGDEPPGDITHLWRGGSWNPGALKPRPQDNGMLSWRWNPSNPYPCPVDPNTGALKPPLGGPGDEYIVIPTEPILQAGGVIIIDNEPPGHASLDMNNSLFEPAGLSEICKEAGNKFRWPK